MKMNYWTIKDFEILKTEWQKLTRKELSKKLKRSKRAISTMASKLKLVEKRKQVCLNCKKEFLTQWKNQSGRQKYCNECGSKIVWKKWDKRQRREVLEHYGGSPPKCKRCGYDTFGALTIDHINGGGNKQRKKIGFSVSFYIWLKKNNYPSEFQVLCRNCNWLKWLEGS